LSLGSSINGCELLTLTIHMDRRFNSGIHLYLTRYWKFL